MSKVDEIIREVFELYEKHGDEDYIGEPVSQLEHMSQAAQLAIDTAKACREVGVKTVAVTAGYITKLARGPFYEVMDETRHWLAGKFGFTPPMTAEHPIPRGAAHGGAVPAMGDD